MPGGSQDEEYRLEEWDLAELDQAIHEKTAVPLKGMRKREDGVVQRLFSALNIVRGGTKTSNRDGRLITCRICNDDINEESYSEHTEYCRALHDSIGELFRTDAFLQRLQQHLAGAQQQLELLTEAALNACEEKGGTRAKAIMRLAKIQYKLTKTRMTLSSPQSITNAERLGFLVERKKNLLERLRVIQPDTSRLTVLLNAVLGRFNSSHLERFHSNRTSPTAIYSLPSIGDFQVISGLSKGAYGTVILCRHKRTGDLYAIKAVRKQHIQRKNTMAHAMTERRALSILSSPWIVGLYFAFQSDTVLYLVMEFMVGGDLGNLLSRCGKMEESFIVFYGAELLTAIGLLHSFSVIHHDIKPENVLIAADGHIKLTDLGLSRMTRNHDHRERRLYTEQLHPMGTPDYMAPEIIKLQPYNSSVDMWAMGCVLYELKHGVPPFHADSPEGIFIKALSGDLVFDEDTSGELKDLIVSLLQVEVEERLTIEGARKHPFFKTIQAWDNLHGTMSPPFVPKPTSDDDTMNFMNGTARRPSLLTDMQQALPFNTLDNGPEVKLSTPGSLSRSGLSTPPSLSGSFCSLSSSPWNDSFAFKNVELLESANRRAGMQLRNATGGAESPLIRGLKTGRSGAELDSSFGCGGDCGGEPQG